MLNKQELVNFINEKLNGINENFKFNIVAEVGETKPGVLSGILLTNKADTPNIPGYDEINYSFTVAVLVPSARTNKKLLQVEQIIGEFCNTYDATEQKFSGTDITLAITPGKPDNLKTEFEIGDCVPLYFTINGLWGNNVTSTKRHWFLDGVEIPFESEGVYLQKDGRTNKIQGIYNTQTLPTGVTKQYRFTFPYSSNFSGLQQDLLSGDFKKIYTLTYYDGVSYTSDAPFSTKVSIFSSGDNNSARTRAAKFNITFTDVDDGETAVKYWLALIDNPFDNQTEDTRWFNSQSEQQAYFEDKISIGCQYEQIKAPNLNSLDITSQVYENTQGYDMLSLVNKNYAIIKIEKTDSSTTPATVTNNYLYYFVQSCQIGANEQYLYDLKLDTIQTYLFDPNIQFSDCFIEKANLNRWIEAGVEYELLITKPTNWETNYTDYYIKSGNNYIANTNPTWIDNTYYQQFEMVKFDGDENSKLFEREDIQNVAKRLVNRKNITISNFTDAQAEQWYEDNIAGWIYVYLDKTHPFLAEEAFNVNDLVPLRRRSEIKNQDSYQQTVLNSVLTPYFVIAYPVYKGTGKICLKDASTYGNKTDTTYMMIDEKAYNLFQSMNETITDGVSTFTPYIKAIKTSGMPPFDASLITSFAIDSDNNLIIDATTDNTGFSQGVYNQNKWFLDINDSSKFLAIESDYPASDGSMSDPFYGFFQVYLNMYQVTRENAINIESRQIKFRKKEIINSDKSPSFNPKLLSSDCFNLRVSDEFENGFDYDLQKYNKTNDISINYIETLNAGTTTKYIFLTPNGLYIDECREALIGFVGKNDTLLPYINTAYDEMIAQSKNFFLQNKTNREYDVKSSMLGIGANIVRGTLGGFVGTGGNPIGAVGGAIIGTATGIASTIMNNSRNKMNENFTVDNLKNAPSNVSQMQGSGYMQFCIDDIGLVVEEWDILPNDKIKINDYMVKYGYNTNLIGNIFDYMNGSPINGRKYFNYIKAQIQNVSGIPMSNVARADIRTRFDNGLRFWNNDVIDYTKENYENWLGDVKFIARVELENNGYLRYNGNIQSPQIVAVYDTDGNVVPSQYYYIGGQTEAVNTGEYTFYIQGLGIYRRSRIVVNWEIYDCVITFNEVDNVMISDGMREFTTSPIYTYNSGTYNFGTTYGNTINIDVSTDGVYNTQTYDDGYYGPGVILTYSGASYVNVEITITST